MVNLHVPKLSTPTMPSRSWLGSWQVQPRRSSIPYATSRTTSVDGVEKQEKLYEDGPIPRVTIHSFIMGIFVSMGGFIFGYDTGTLSLPPHHELTG
jgi:hypothetical protein